jgi:hypothetical protein
MRKYLVMRTTHEASGHVDFSPFYLLGPEQVKGDITTKTLEYEYSLIQNMTCKKLNSNIETFTSILDACALTIRCDDDHVDGVRLCL